MSEDRVREATDAFLCALPEQLRGKLGRKHVMEGVRAVLAHIEEPAAARTLAMIRRGSPPPRLTVLYSGKEDHDAR